MIKKFVFFLITSFFSIQSIFANPEATSEPFTPPFQEEITAPSYQGAFIKMLLTLGGLVGLIFFMIYLLRKMTQGRIGAFGKKQVTIIERRPLSPKTILYIVEVSGKQILIAESHLEIKTLTTIDPPLNS